jgi:hypothetical protein
MMRHLIRYTGILFGLYLLIHFVGRYEWETIYSPHAVSVHFDDWDPIVPLAYGWGFGAYLLLTLGATSKWFVSKLRTL